MKKTKHLALNKEIILGIKYLKNLGVIGVLNLRDNVIDEYKNTRETQIEEFNKMYQKKKKYLDIYNEKGFDKETYIRYKGHIKKQVKRINIIKGLESYTNFRYNQSIKDLNNQILSGGMDDYKRYISVNKLKNSKFIDYIYINYDKRKHHVRSLRKYIALKEINKKIDILKDKDSRNYSKSGVLSCGVLGGIISNACMMDITLMGTAIGVGLGGIISSKVIKPMVINSGVNKKLGVFLTHEDGKDKKYDKLKSKILTYSLLDDNTHLGVRNTDYNFNSIYNDMMNIDSTIIIGLLQVCANRGVLSNKIVNNDGWDKIITISEIFEEIDKLYLKDNTKYIANDNDKCTLITDENMKKLII